MIVEVNGGKHDVADGSTVTQLLAQLSLPTQKVAVERNRVLVPRSQHMDTVLQAGDKLEIVHFVGGG